MPRSMRSNAVCCTQTCVSTPKRMASCCEAVKHTKMGACPRKPWQLGVVVSCSYKRPLFFEQATKIWSPFMWLQVRSFAASWQATKVTNFQKTQTWWYENHANYKWNVHQKVHQMIPQQKGKTSSQLPLKGIRSFPAKYHLFITSTKKNGAFRSRPPR